MSNWWRFGIGFAVSVAVGGAVLYGVLERFLWDKYFRDHPNVPRPNYTTTRVVGLLERLMYTGALCAGIWQWVGFWLALKVTVRWRTKTEPDGPSDNIWLIGTGLSVLFGFLGAWIALGHLPVVH